jgi:hypothetical protein
MLNHSPCTCCACVARSLPAPSDPDRHDKPSPAPHTTFPTCRRVDLPRGANERSRYRESADEIWAIAMGEARARKAPKRASRANFAPRPPPRARVYIKPCDEDTVLEYLHLASARVRSSLLESLGGREGWIAGVWLEIQSRPANDPPAAHLCEHVDRAIWRLEKNQRRHVDSPAPVSPSY